MTLVGKDRQTKLFMAHVVPLKGGDFEWITGQVAKDLKKFGIQGDVVLRSDQEPAIKDMLQEVAKQRPWARTVVESSPSGDSKSNGFAERAVQSIEELVRVHKLALERRLGQRLKVSHP